MRIVEQTTGSSSVDGDGVDGDWAARTRRVLTRDLLLRAGRAQPTESQALQFRALHLNLPLVGEVADRLGLTADDRVTVEHDALDGLVQAVLAFDPCGGQDFAAFAVPFVEREVRRTLHLLAGVGTG